MIKRTLNNEEKLFRALKTDDGKRYIEGYAAVFNVRSKQLFENNKFFYEIIDPTAFDGLLVDGLDVIFTPNHQIDKVIARTINNTLKLEIDEKGLKFTAEINNTTYSNDLYLSIERGDIYECSFIFFIKNDNDSSEWSTDENGDNIRTIKKIAKLVEVSSVTFGAYPQTDVAARDNDININEIENDLYKIENEIDKMKLSILKLK